MSFNRSRTSFYTELQQVVCRVELDGGEGTNKSFKISRCSHPIKSQLRLRLGASPEAGSPTRPGPTLPSAPTAQQRPSRWAWRRLAYPGGQRRYGRAMAGRPEVELTRGVPFFFSPEDAATCALRTYIVASPPATARPTQTRTCCCLLQAEEGRVGVIQDSSGKMNPTTVPCFHIAFGLLGSTISNFSY